MKIILYIKIIKVVVLVEDCGKVDNLKIHPRKALKNKEFILSIPKWTTTLFPVNKDVDKLWICVKVKL